MKCVVCKVGETAPGMTTVTLEHDGFTLVVKSVPAQVCENCGEEYIDEDIVNQLLQTGGRSRQGRCTGGCAGI
jgi:YgiT-type zinc finger domain-containing protein